MPSYSGVFTLQAQMQAKAANNWPDPNVPSVIGQAFGGGFWAGQIGVAGVATHNLVVGPLSTAEFTGQWKNVNTATPGADSVINGPQNTIDMVNDGNATIYPCAHFCNNLSTGGQTDWYMPAQNELEVCYFNLKPTTQANNTSSGINANAVPARASNYTSGTPAQTSAANFITTTGAQAFSSLFYWSSTEDSVTNARAQSLGYGYQFGTTKYNFRPVRAVRRVPV